MLPKCKMNNILEIIGHETNEEALTEQSHNSITQFRLEGSISVQWKIGSSYRNPCKIWALYNRWSKLIKFGLSPTCTPLAGVRLVLLLKNEIN